MSGIWQAGMTLLRLLLVCRKCDGRARPAFDLWSISGLAGKCCLFVLLSRVITVIGIHSVTLNRKTHPDEEEVAGSVLYAAGEPYLGVIFLFQFALMFLGSPQYLGKWTHRAELLKWNSSTLENLWRSVTCLFNHERRDGIYVTIYYVRRVRSCDKLYSARVASSFFRGVHR